MISYVLNKEISAEKIIQDIDHMVTKFKQNNLDKTPILYIDIRTISNENTTLIPKVEYKNQSGCIT